MANTLEIPSLTDVPIIRNPAPGIDVSASLGPKNPSDILRDPRFFKLPPAEQTAIKRMVMAKVTGAGGALAPGTYPRTITPGMVTRKPIMPEVARKAKMSDQAQNILTLTQEMQDLYNSKLKDKIEKGQMSEFHEGAKYVYPNMLGKPDPDVEKWMVKSGQLGQMVNSYYSQTSGGRGGVTAYQVITQPHIPTPPASLFDLTGTPERRQWSLSEQVGWLPEIQHRVQVQEGLAPPETFKTAPGAPNAAGSDLDDLRRHGLVP